MKTVSLATLHIQLEDSSPLIWRRVRVPLDTSLDELHYVIQMTMGWTNAHQFVFRIGEKEYQHADEDSFLDADFSEETDISLKKALGKAKSFNYTYDFGDGWEHRITVESIEKKSDDWNFPVCLAGAHACPPEDVGGIPGYADFCQKLADPRSTEYEETLLWAGGAFDPLSFDINRVNRELHGMCIGLGSDIDADLFGDFEL